MGYLRTNSKKHTKLLTPHFIWKKYPGKTNASGTPVYVAANSSTAYPHKQVQDGDYYMLDKRDFTEQYTWADVASIAKTGQAQQVFQVGDEFCYYGDSQLNVMVIVGFEQDVYASGGKAQITFLSRGVPPRAYQASSSAIPTGYSWSWAGCSLRTTCNSTLLGTLPADLQAVIKPVTKKSVNNFQTSYNLVTSEDSIWIPSPGELYTSNTSSNLWTLDDRYSSTCYSFFPVGQSKVGFSRSIGGSRVKYWLRSGPKNQAKSNALYYNTDNSFQYQDANTYAYDTYIVFGFCI